MAFSGSNKNLKGAFNQSDLYRETQKKYGRNTDAYHDALDAIKVSRVSFSKEFEDFRQLPKYSHVPLAVIHPSPIKRMPKPRRPEPDFEVEASPSRIIQRPGPRYEIPESLARPPVEISAGGRKRRPKSGVGFGSSQPRFGSRIASAKSSSKFADRQDAERAKIEQEKLRVINQNVKSFYDTLKAGLEKPDDDDVFCESCPAYTVREAKNHNRVHALLGQLNVRLNDGDPHMASKLHLKGLLQAFVKLSDSQCNDIFNNLTKKAEPRSNSRGERG